MAVQINFISTRRRGAWAVREQRLVGWRNSRDRIRRIGAFMAMLSCTQVRGNLFPHESEASSKPGVESADFEADNRGTWKSGGDVVLGGTQEGEDGYDIVEWIAEQPWCNGKVSMAGNSYLAQTQWYVGAQKPPSLACLAPWEGWSDVYNDCVRRGGPYLPIPFSVSVCGFSS